MDLRKKDNMKKRLISGIMAILLFGTGMSVGKEVSKDKYPRDCYYPLFSNNNIGGYDTSEPIVLSGNDIIDGKKVSKIIDSLQDENKYDELVYAFRALDCSGSLYSDIIYVSQSGNPTSVSVIDSVSKINIVTGDILYKDGEESNLQRDRVFQDINPISTKELKEYEFIPFPYINQVNGVDGTFNDGITYILHKKQK